MLELWQASTAPGKRVAAAGAWWANTHTPRDLRSGEAGDLLGALDDGAGDVEAGGLLQSLETGTGVDLQHHRPGARLEQVDARHLEAHRVRGAESGLGERGRQLERRTRAAAVQVAAEAVARFAPHRPGDAPADHHRPHVAAARFGDELLQEDLLPQVLQR